VPTIGFFGAQADLVALTNWLLADEGLHACEAYSAFDSVLRHFRTCAEVAAAFDIGDDRLGTGTAIYLALWKPQELPAPRPERITLKPGACGGATFRFQATGNGLIYLQLGGVNGRVITQSHIAQNSEARAETWGVADGVDWERARKLWGRIQYHLRRRVSVASAGGSPILAQAHSLAEQGYELRQDVRSRHTFAVTSVRRR
jgi:hypothetical protein